MQILKKITHLNNSKIRLILLLFLIGFGSFSTLQAQDAVAVSKMIPGTIDSIEIGSPFQYQITVRCDNTGTEPCTNFIVRDTLPLGLEFSSSDISQAIFTAGGFGTNNPPLVVDFDSGLDPTFATPAFIELDFGDVAPGSSTVVTLNVRFSPVGNYPDGTTVTNTATVSSDNDVDLTNNSVTSVPIEAEASMNWNVDKRNSSVGAIGDLTSYNILLSHPASNTGSLALYDVIIFDILETGLTCADVDPATTTGLAAGDHALCLAPGASGTFLSGTTVTNPSTTDYALAWDYDALFGYNEPFVKVNPICDACTFPHTRPSFSIPPIDVGIIYPSPTFVNGQTVVNNAELWGATAADLGGNTTTPIGFLDQDNASHSVNDASAAGNFTKSMTAGALDSTYVGAGTEIRLRLTNTGNVNLTDVVISDSISTELGNISRIIVTPISSTVTLHYTDGSTEIVMVSGVISEGTDFNIPVGEQIEFVETALNGPLGPGVQARVTIYPRVLPQRFDDDNHTAENDNPSQTSDIDLGTQLAGSDVALGDEITNCGSYEAMSVTGPLSDSECALLYVIESYITARLLKTVTPTSPQPVGSTLTFNAGLTNSSNLSRLESFTMSDTLPQGLTFIPGSFSSPHPANFTYTPNINGTDRDLLQWTVTDLSTANVWSTVSWMVVIDPDHQAGTFENSVFLTDFESPPGGPLSIRERDLIRLDTSGYTTPQSNAIPNTIGAPSGNNAADAVYNILAIPSGASMKYVDADITPGQTPSGGVELGSPGSMATFTLLFENSGNDTLQNLRIIDLLPRIGDMSPLTCTPRNTAWDPMFSGSITTTFVSNGVTTTVTPTIEYSTDPDPCVDYWVPGPEPCLPCNAGTFSTTPPATLGDVLGLGFDFGTLKVPPSDSLLVSFNVIIPNSPSPDGIAWNTFAWSGTGIVSGAEVGAEPPLVGLSTDEFDLALTKVVSASTPGPFTPGSTVSFDIRVVNQGDLISYDIDVLDYFNTTELNFVGFSNPTTTAGSNPVIITATDIDGTDGITGFEVSELAIGDEVTVTATFTIDAAFSGSSINNDSEIVAGSVFDGGETTFDVDSDLALTGGSGTEVDDEIADESNGGTDDPNDQDDFDFATIIICTSPSAMFTPAIGTCSGTTANNDATIELTGIMNADEANVSTGATYTGAAYNGAGAVDVSSGAGTITGLMHNTEYTVRIFNGSNDCFIDSTLMTSEVICCPGFDITLEVSDPEFCDEQTVLVQVSNSEFGFFYQLENTNGNALTGSPVAGNGNAIEIEATDITATGSYIYNVIVSVNGTACSATLTDQANVTIQECDFPEEPPVGCQDFDPCHVISADLYLGSGSTADTGTGTTDDNDGVIFPNDIQPGGTINLPITIFNNTTNDAYLTAWIDWNGDGDFDDTGEQIANETYPFATNSGSFVDYIEVTVPSDAVQDVLTYAIFRLSTDDLVISSVCSNTGACAVDGEVEVYSFTPICKAPVCVPPLIQINKN